MPYIVGLLLALVVGLYAAAMRLDRDGAFYPTVLIVVASYYVLFGAMAGSPQVVAAEAAIMGVFVLAASIGFRRAPMLVAVGLVAHGVMDVFHGQLVANPGVPAWWPAWCMSYDVVAGAILWWRLTKYPTKRLAAADR